MPTVAVEGSLRGKFVRAYWEDGKVDMHPLVRKACDDAIALGLEVPSWPGHKIYTKGFYQSGEGFVALMRGTLDSITKITGIEPPQKDPRLID